MPSAYEEDYQATSPQKPPARLLPRSPLKPNHASPRKQTLYLKHITEITKKYASSIEGIQKKADSHKKPQIWHHNPEICVLLQPNKSQIALLNSIGHGAFKIARIALKNGQFVVAAYSSHGAKLKAEIRNITYLEEQLPNSDRVHFLLPQIEHTVFKTTFISTFCNKGTLKEQQKALTPAQKNKIGLDILNGIFCMSKIQFIHRDIKPDNILLTEEDGNIITKISDFGISTYNEKRKMLRKYPMLYTPTEVRTLFTKKMLYQPKEWQERLNELTHDLRYDVFSAGMTLLYLFAGWPNNTITRMQPEAHLKLFQKTTQDKIQNPKLQALILQMIAPLGQRLNPQQALEQYKSIFQTYVTQEFKRRRIS